MAITTRKIPNYSINIARRKTLLQLIKKRYPDQEGLILFFSGFDDQKQSFQQESSFYYFTGLIEPSLVMTIDFNGKTTLYLPNYAYQRAQWIVSQIPWIKDNPQVLGFDEIKRLGKTCMDSQFHPFFAQGEYENLLSDLQPYVKNKQPIFTLY